MTLKTKELRIKTLAKFLTLYTLAIDRDRILTAQEVMDTIGCCRSHAYNYLRALNALFSTMIA